MKLLNLEALTKSVVKRVVKIGDAEYEIKTVNVQQFLEILDETKALALRAEQGEFVMPDEVRLYMKIAGFALPDVSFDVIENLDLNQLQAIVAFAKGEDVDGVIEEGEAQKTDGQAEESQEGK